MVAHRFKWIFIHVRCLWSIDKSELLDIYCWGSLHVYPEHPRYLCRCYLALFTHTLLSGGGSRTPFPLLMRLIWVWWLCSRRETSLSSLSERGRGLCCMGSPVPLGDLADWLLRKRGALLGWFNLFTISSISSTSSSRNAGALGTTYSPREFASNNRLSILLCRASALCFSFSLFLRLNVRVFFSSLCSPGASDPP